MLLSGLVLAAAVTSAPIDREVIRPSPPDNRPECRDLRRHIRATEPARAELLAYRGAGMKATRLVMRSMTMQNGCVVPPPEGFHPTYLLPGRADAPRHRPISDGAGTKR